MKTIITPEMYSDIATQLNKEIMEGLVDCADHDRIIASRLNKAIQPFVIAEEVEACAVTPEMLDEARDIWSATLRPCKQCPYPSCEFCRLEGMSKVLTTALQKRARGEE